MILQAIKVSGLVLDEMIHLRLSLAQMRIKRLLSEF